VGVVHTMPAPGFISGEPDSGTGLEPLAEDGNAAPLADAHALAACVNSLSAPVA
jgi:hypothetical protein